MAIETVLTWKNNKEEIVFSKIKEKPMPPLMLAFYNSGEGLTDTAEILLAADAWLIEYAMPVEDAGFFNDSQELELEKANQVADARLQLAKFAHALNCNHPDFDNS